jgi:hypothetical protein
VVSEAALLILPKFDYHLDESDTDVLVLRRQDGAFVAAFSAGGATREGIVDAAEDDYRALLWGTRGPTWLGGRGAPKPKRLSTECGLFTVRPRRVVLRTSAVGG